VSATPAPGSTEEAEARRNVGKGPFKVEKDLAYLGGDMAVGGEEPEMVQMVAVADAAGEPFCYVHPDDCAGGDLTSAKARATRIAEALNRSPFRDGEVKLPLHVFEGRAGITIGEQFVYPGASACDLGRGQEP
jgi:hypothetical protein